MLTHLTLKRCQLKYRRICIGAKTVELGWVREKPLKAELPITSGSWVLLRVVVTPKSPEVVI